MKNIPSIKVREFLSCCESDYIGENNECYSLSTISCHDLFIITKKVSSSKNKCVPKTSCVNYGKYYYDNVIIKNAKINAMINIIIIQIINVWKLVQLILI